MMRAAAALSTILILGACASTQPLKESDRKGITTVAVSPDVRVSPELYYFGAGSSFGLLFGAVGGAAMAAANQGPAEQLRQFATQNNISIEEIVRKQFTAQLVTRRFRVSDGNADATFKLDVRQYGLSVPTGFSSDLVPVLTVHAELLNGNGQVMWSTTKRVHPLSGVSDSVPLETIRGNPELLRTMWTQAAQQVVLEMMETLQ